MEELSDDEAIATAMLLGCEFFRDTSASGPDKYYVHGDSENLHPLERARARGRSSIKPWGDKVSLARDYIKFTLESNDGA